MFRNYAIFSVIAIAAISITACGDDDGDKEKSDSAQTKTSKPSTDATVSFVTPSEGSTEGKSFTAEVELAKFAIDKANVGKAPVEGKGHLHFSLDGGKYDFPKYSGANGKLAKKLGVDGQYSPSVAPEITYSNIPAGEHELKIELVDNAHRPIGSDSTTVFNVE